MKRIRFKHGRRYRFKCRKCGNYRSGIVYRELFCWRAKMECGHHREMGYTKPLDVLEAEGLIER